MRKKLLHIRRLLFTLTTYFAKCQLFSTFFVVKYNPVSQYTYIFCVSLFSIFHQQICSMLFFQQFLQKESHPKHKKQNHVLMEK